MCVDSMPDPDNIGSLQSMTLSAHDQSTLSASDVLQSSTLVSVTNCEPGSKRSATNDTCDVPLKRATTHSNVLLGTLISPGYTPGHTPGRSPGHIPRLSHGHTPGYTPGHSLVHTPGHTCVCPAATLPSFPPTLFSCFPSLGNSRLLGNSQMESAVPVSSSLSSNVTPTISTTTTHLASTAHLSSINTTLHLASSSTCTTHLSSDASSTAAAAVSTLFSIPVHGAVSTTCPLLLVPSLKNVVLISSLGSTPVLYVLNASPPSRVTSTSPAARMSHVAGNLQSSSPILSHLLRPVGGAIHLPTPTPSTAGNLCQLHISSQNVPLYSPVGGAVQQPVGGASSTLGGSVPQCASVGTVIPHGSSTLPTLSVPNVPLDLRPFRSVRGAVQQPVGGASCTLGGAISQCASVGAVIPHVSGSLQTLSVPNVPLALRPFRLVGGAVQQPVGGGSSTLGGSVPQCASVGTVIPHVSSTLQTLSVPNVPLALRPFRSVGGAVQQPVGGASSADQSCAFIASNIRIPQSVGNFCPSYLSLPFRPMPSQWLCSRSSTTTIVGNSLPLGLPLSLLTHLRSVGGATHLVNQSAVRLVSSVGICSSVPASSSLSTANTSVATVLRLNGMINAQRCSQLATAGPDSVHSLLLAPPTASGCEGGENSTLLSVVDTHSRPTLSVSAAVTETVKSSSATNSL